jgi:hypothetical protein
VDPHTPQRIRQRYPGIKLVASLRNPINRAYSNYMNDIIKGTVKRETTYSEALVKHPEYVEQGLYFSQLQRYLKYFARDQLLVLVYEDILGDPLGFIQSIYHFIGVNPSFIPSMAFTRINRSRIPRFLWIDRILRKASEFLRRKGLFSLWWFAKKASLGSSIRAVNTLQPGDKTREFSPSERGLSYEMFKDDIEELENLLGRELKEWRQ